MMFNRDDMKEQLSKSFASVSFRKKDGSIRTMNCTLVPEYLPELVETTKKPRKVNEEVLSVWDLDNQDWRSFRLDSVKEVVYYSE